MPGFAELFKIQVRPVHCDDHAADENARYILTDDSGTEPTYYYATFREALDAAWTFALRNVEELADADNYEETP